MSMIEKVAKAIYEKRYGAGCKPWSRQPGSHRQPYLDDARAAIEAMREPTEAMIADGCLVEQLVLTSVSSIYGVMIASALSEEG